MRTLSFFAASTAVLLVGCAGAKQSASMVLYDADLNGSTGVGEAKSYREEIEIGPEERRVPVEIAWSTQKDDSGCMRVSHLKVSRLGGAESVAIDPVRHSAIPDCGMKFDAEDPVKYETVVISLAYKTNIFLKTYRFNGGVAAVQGNGEFVDLARVQ